MHRLPLHHCSVDGRPRRDGCRRLHLLVALVVVVPIALSADLLLVVGLRGEAAARAHANGYGHGRLVGRQRRRVGEWSRRRSWRRRLCCCGFIRRWRCWWRWLWLSDRHAFYAWPPQRRLRRWRRRCWRLGGRVGLHIPAFYPRRRAGILERHTASGTGKFYYCAFLHAVGLLHEHVLALAERGHLK